MEEFGELKLFKEAIDKANAKLAQLCSDQII
jgi:hypothetical protein